MAVHDELEQVFRDAFGNESIVLRDDMTAADVPEWDSLGQINLMFTIEEQFGVTFEGSQFAEFTNVGELETYLEEHARDAV